MFQAPNVGVGGKDHGNRRKEYCFQVKFLDEHGRVLCMEPYTITASDGDTAREMVQAIVDIDCEAFDYYEGELYLEDVC